KNTGNPATPAKKEILILFPFRSDQPASIIAVQAIKEEFGNAADLKADLYFEYFDFNRFKTDEYKQQMLSLYPAKYRQKSIDLVIIAGTVMLDFWLAHRKEILPNKPVVFFDVVTKSVASRQFPPDVTGVTAVVDYIQTLTWVLLARPSIKEIVIVHGVGTVDKDYIFPVDEMKKAFHGRLQLTDLSNLPLTEIKRRAAALPDSSVVLYHLMFEDAAGVKYRPIDALRELTRVSTVPVITAYDQFIGTGTIGGYMYSIEQQAKRTVRIGLRILRGEPANLMPITANQSNPFIFDHLALQRYGIGLSELPAKSIVKNRQYSLWENYRFQIIAGCAVIVLLTLLVLFLVVLTQKLTISRQALSKLNADLEALVQERTAALITTNHHLEDEIAERKRVQTELEKVVAELQGALAKVIELEGILPICSFCKKIRDNDGCWQVMESYIGHHSHAQFSHSLCPECAMKHYPEFFDDAIDQ
ncbi:MAG: hypothetical protein HQK57_11325, partial [Deltaproteobacteria bacterium]|nr:hypothetical protein [Deltaproteobacteria bacterium]